MDKNSELFTKLTLCTNELYHDMLQKSIVFNNRLLGVRKVFVMTTRHVKHIALRWSNRQLHPPGASSHQRRDMSIEMWMARLRTPAECYVNKPLLFEKINTSPKTLHTRLPVLI